MNRNWLWNRQKTDRQNAESELILAALHGDFGAYEALIRPHESLLRGFLVRRVGSTGAEDVLQETRLAAWTDLKKFGCKVSFKSWLLGIALHKSADYFRSQARRQNDFPLEGADHLSAPGSVEAEVERSEIAKSLLACLPEEQRELIELYYYGELTLAEAAAALERNLNTVKAQFYRAHRQMKLSAQGAETDFHVSTGGL